MNKREVVRYREGWDSPQVIVASLVEKFGTGDPASVTVTDEELQMINGILEAQHDEQAMSTTITLHGPAPAPGSEES